MKLSLTLGLILAGLVCTHAFADEQLDQLVGVLKVAGAHSQAVYNGQFSSCEAFYERAADGQALDAYKKLRDDIADAIDRHKSYWSEDQANVLLGVYVGWYLTGRYNLTYRYNHAAYYTHVDYSPEMEHTIYLHHGQGKFIRINSKELQRERGMHWSDRAFLGAQIHEVVNGELRTIQSDTPQDAWSLTSLDPSLLPWNKFPKKQLVRDDQDLKLIFVDRERVDYQLTNKNSGMKVDQIFNLQTGMMERITATDKGGALQEEFQWLGAYKNPDSIWLPRAMIHMKMGPAIVELQARIYWKWQLRPVTSDELVIPTTAYHKIIEPPKQDKDKKDSKKTEKPKQQKGNFKVQK